MMMLRSTTALTAWRPTRSLAPPRGAQGRGAVSIVRSNAVDAPPAATIPQEKMFCYQCEQTANGTGCTTIGNCGKTPEVAGLQDLLIHSVKGLGSLSHHARTIAGIEDEEVNSFLLQALFSTLTNVNFDDERFKVYIDYCTSLHKQLASKMAESGKALPPAPKLAFFGDMPHPMDWNTAQAATGGSESVLELIDVAKLTSLTVRRESLGATVAGLQELVVYGLKGLAAYAAHAEALGSRDPDVFAFIGRSLWFLSTEESTDAGNVLAMAMEVGVCNKRVLQMLSEAHSDMFGAPVPTEVSLVPVEGKCILVTGHDMHDIHQLLIQTEGKGINVYTHGEMMPAHGYPELKKFKHLKGNYGGAWYLQKKDFSYFPGAILATTNCVIEPLSNYRKNMFTTGSTGLSNVAHVEKDFTPIITRALALPGFDARGIERAEADRKGHKTSVTVGFGHQAVLSAAGKVVDAVKTGKAVLGLAGAVVDAVKTERLSHIFLVGGCDGHEPQRDYYSKLGEQLPKDTMLLTLGCGKFRIYDQEFGTLGDTGLPRLMDMGQCNDAYSALVVATELAKAFDTDINSLPLSMDISWFEQKAVAVLLTMLSMGVKNIRLGPALPAFLTAEAVQVLVDKYDLKPADVANPGTDLQKMMQRL
ncbi:hypothetical protein FOA52_014327 [Chlamydomonas sp. UWO 241]|nr:hypothetical protein FOA52_014327 [Chlamydomonas sp. UWO 241]